VCDVLAREPPNLLVLIGALTNNFTVLD
jgi:hypothetical protein